MKLEIGESLAATWLRYIKGCEVVQLNWKAGPDEIVLTHELLKKMVAVEEAFQKEGDKPIFGSDQRLTQENRLKQVLKQGEIDVVGLKISKSSSAIKRLHFVDVAIHRKGLGYRDNKTKLVQKMARAALLMHAVFQLPPEKGHLWFITPKVGLKSKKSIESALCRLADVLERQGIGYELKLLCNEEFAEHVVEQVLIDRNAIADTAHLFLRTLQCLDAAGYRSQIDSLIRGTDTDSPVEPATAGSAPTSIGLYVQQTFGALIKKELISPEMVQNLIDAEYCRTVFGLGHPMLRENTATNSDERVALRTDQNGYRRYWVDTQTIIARSYFLCSQWYAKQFDRYESWLKTVRRNQRGA